MRSRPISTAGRATSSLGAVPALVAGIVLVLAPPSAQAQTCTIANPPETGITELSYRLAADGAPSDADYWLDCGYGTPVWDYYTSGIFCRYPVIGGAGGQSYAWTAKAAKHLDHSQVYCSKTGTITVYDCIVTCNPIVPDKVEKGKPFILQGFAGTSHCRGDWLGDWKVFKGGVLWAQCPWESSCQVSLSPAGTYDWQFTAAASWGDHNPFLEGRCVTTDQIVVEDPTLTELRVGSIVFKATTIVKQQGVHEYTLTGNVRANEMLRFAGPITFKGNPATGTGDLFTDAALSVATAGTLGPVTLLSGTNQYYLVDGNANPARLTPQLLVPPTELGFRLHGVPLYFVGNMAFAEAIQIAADGILVAPRLFIGNVGGLRVGAVRVLLVLRPGQPVALSASELMETNTAPGVELDLPLELAYDGGSDALSGKVDVHFPYLRITREHEEEDQAFDLGVSDGCVTLLDTEMFAEEEDIALHLGPGERPGLGVERLAITNICDSASYAPMATGYLYFGRDHNVLGTAVTAWRYDPPRTMRLIGGPARFLGRDIASPAGAWVGANDFDSLLLNGWYGTGGGENDSDVIKGTLTLGAISASPPRTRWHANGWLKGTFVAAGSYCDCPPDAGEECEIAASAFEALGLGEGSSGGVTFDVSASGSTSKPQGTGFFKASGVFPNLPEVGVFVSRDVNKEGEASVTCYVLGNLVPQPTSASAGIAARRTAVVERAATFEKAEEPAVFGCVGKGGTLPSIYLRNPAGQLITPATAGRYTGMGYASDTGSSTAVLAAVSASPGTWAIGVDNLSESDVSCTILTVQPPPEVSFTGVEQSGASVSIAVSVSPAAATTTVSLFYSQLADGLPEGEIASDLAADTGTVSATWDTTTVPTGSYFVFARTDDGLNPPLTTIHQPAIEVVNGALQPPTALQATRTAETATLTWAPSLSGDAAGYTVRYTDDPDAAGYPLSAAAPMASGATVYGLDPRASYRFCVAAFGLDGLVSPCSTSVVLGPKIRLRRVVPH
jgi:hypothetical protein